MARHAFTRARTSRSSGRPRHGALLRGGIAAATTLALAASFGPLTTTAVAADPAELVIPAEVRAEPRGEHLMSAGATGYLHSQEGSVPRLWTDYSTGRTTAVPPTMATSDRFASGGWTSDVVALATDDRGPVVLRDMRTGAEQRIEIPDGQYYSSTFGSTVLTYTPLGDLAGSWHLLHVENGELVDRRVTGVPEGAVLSERPINATTRGLLTTYSVGGEVQQGWVDLESAGFRRILADRVSPGARWTLGEENLLRWRTDGVAEVYDTADFSVPPREVRIPFEEQSRPLAVVADFLVVGRWEQVGGETPKQRDFVHRLVALPFDGGPERLLLEDASGQVSRRPDGGLVVAAGGDPEGRAVYAVETSAGSGLEVRKLIDVPAVRGTTVRVRLSQGRLTTLDHLPTRWTRLQGREITPGSPPTAGEARQITVPEANFTPCFSSAPCAEARPTGDGRLVVDEPLKEPFVLDEASGEVTGIPTTLESVGVEEVSGRHVVLSGHTGDVFERHVVDLDTGRTLLTRPAGPTALRGATLWMPGSTRGTVTATDVRTGRTLRTVDLKSGCTPDRLKAAGAWLAWECPGSPRREGAYDTSRALAVPLTDVPVRALGDGFVVDVDNDERLVVRDIRSGTPVVRHTATVRAQGADYGWTVDPAGNHVAYVDPENAVRVLDTGVPASALSVTDAEAPASAAVKSTPWQGRWWLSKPVSSWRLAIRSAATGATVRTLDGDTARGLVEAGWDGTDTGGALVPNGSYTWTLTAKPADGHGADLTATGTIALSGGAAVQRDHAGANGVPDGFGDLVTVNSNGTLTFQQGDGEGGLSGNKTYASGWSTSVTPVPTGDMGADRCNDLLVRMTDGELRRYLPACGAAVSPATKYVSLGTGWGAYDVLTVPGDLTGDAKADLVARKSSTGDVYLFATTADGRLAAGKKIRSAWKYNKIAGVGDLDGDGFGDLVARDASGELWRYDGTAAGQFEERELVFSDWGASYVTVVGPGDMTGDGKADLVALDEAGNLYRNTGDGKGSFSSRTQIASGWNVYKGVF